MPVITNREIKKDEFKYAAYRARVHHALAKINRLERGARGRCSFDIRMHPSSISNILNIRVVSDAGLARIEEWLKDEVL